MNIITRISIGSVLAALALSLMPVIAHAYLTPDEVLTNSALPPTRRETEDAVKARQQQTAAQREEIQSGLPSTEDEPEALEPAAPIYSEDESIGETFPSLLSDEGLWDRRQERLQDQNAGGTTIIIQNGGDGFAPVIRDKRTGQILHSGAPRTSETGMGTVIAIAILFAVATGTFLWAQRKEWKVARLMK